MTYKSTIIEADRARLLFLDGLRGLAALYVTLFHTHDQIDRDFHPIALSPMASFVYRLLSYGHYAVAIFIVLSGYCLMLPVARSQSLSIPGGVSRYLLRRGRRILPPYYAALACSLGLIAAVPALQHAEGEPWIIALPAFGYGSIVSHLFLIHSFSTAWTSRIDPPMWSVGIEWWIYFMFPAILLPFWRRIGLYGSVGVAAILGLGAHFIPMHSADLFCPWYFTLFAFGAAAAYINFSPAARQAQSRNWSLITVVSCGAAFLLLIFAPAWSGTRWYFSDTVVGAAASAFVVWCGKEVSESADTHFVIRVLESRILLGLGTVSYSLYLVHYPMIALLRAALRTSSLSSEAQLYIMIAGGAGASLATACVFHHLFERPFLAGRRENVSKQHLAPVSSLAPESTF